jgi:hypothetical protein
MLSTTDWYAPDPSDLRRSKVTLHFGLRGDDLFYRQLVVPQAGRVWFVRELSWSLGALALMPRLQAELTRVPSSVAVAHALEAVGSKLEYYDETHRNRTPRAVRRTLGIRAFDRDRHSERWAFKELSKSENYVQNTLRQTITASLRTDGGLGLAAGRRFVEMRPIGRGAALAEAFLRQTVGKGGANLGAKLVQWIGAEAVDEHEEFLEGLTPVAALGTECTPTERDIVASALFEGTGSQVDTRRALREVLRASEDLPDREKEIVPALRERGRREQALEVVAALSFGALLDATIELALATAAPIGASRSRVRLDALVRDAEVSAAYEHLRQASARYKTAADQAGTWHRAPVARQLAEDVASKSATTVLSIVLKRAPELFDLSDGSVGPGNLFRRIAVDPFDQGEVALEEGAIMTAPAMTDRTFNLEAFHQLVRDVEGAA